MIDIEQELKEMFLTQIDVEESLLLPETKLEELDVDSLELLEFCVAVEYEFDIDLAEESLSRCRTLGEVADLIAALITEANQ
jgi:acyl carrier protein